MDEENKSCAGQCASTQPDEARRRFLKTSLGGAVAAVYGDLALNPKMVFASKQQAFEKLIPADKGLSPAYLASLTVRDKAETYRGWEEQLRYIGMPVGGIGCGQLYLGGDGRLWLWDIFKSNYQREPDHGERIDSMSAGGHYARPVAFGEVYNKWNGAAVDQGFAIQVKAAGKTSTRTLDHMGFPGVSFRGEYPVGKVHYQDHTLPVEVLLEAFSPFIPGDAADSALPATVLSLRIRNTSASAAQVELLGWLENATCPYVREAGAGQRVNEINNVTGRTSILSTIEPGDSPRDLAGVHGRGSMTLSLLHPHTDVTAAAVPNLDTSANIAGRFDNARNSQDTVYRKALDQTLTGAITAAVTLQPGESVDLDYLLSWYFPDHQAFNSLSVYRFYGPKDFAIARRHYASRFTSAIEVAEYVSDHRQHLLGTTRLWNQTWYDSTLPHWFLDRTFIAINCVATQMFHWFDNGRPYAWEGVDCCPGTCTHVWHYAQCLSRIFPELERLFREVVDYGIGFNPKTGEIGARGEIFVEKSAVDGHAGTILRVYREHQMSSDDQFLQRLWPRVRLSVEFLMAQDEDQSGLLRGRQYNTLDAAWYGPMGWISSLYLAALAAAKAMALEVDDHEFARLCDGRLQRGRENITKELFNGEYFIHLPDPDYPNAIRSGAGCHIDQVLGQAWTHQVNLERVVPKEETVSALNSLWTYNFAPDAGQYAFDNVDIEPAYRVYAMPGEAGLVMCSWPRGGALEAIPDRKFFGLFSAEPRLRPAENPATWTGPGGYFNECMNGFEYQVAWHMISEGQPDDELVHKGLAVTRALHDRYGAKKRNPYNEIECSDHYARSMASYGIFLAACGFEYHGPKGHIGFSPKVNPQHFKSAFTAAEGWGSYEQSFNESSLSATLSLAQGSLTLNSISLQLPEHGFSVNTVTCEGNPVQFSLGENKITLEFDQPINLQAGERTHILIA